MRAGHVAAGVAALGCVLVAGSAIALAGGDRPAGTSSVTALPDIGSFATRAPATRPPASTIPPQSGARLTMPDHHVRAVIVRVKLHGTVMQVPRDPDTVGWWSEGAVPGAATGSAVIVGHVNYGGVDGAFGHLAAARPGDTVRLSRPSLHFRVTAIRSYSKSTGIPAAAFDRAGPPRLVLITCGGAFDATSGNYEDNVVVYAVRDR